MEKLKAKIEGIKKYKTATISGLNDGEKTFLPYFFGGKNLVVVSSLDALDNYVLNLKALGQRVISFNTKLSQIFSIYEKNSQQFKDFCSNLKKIAIEDYDTIVVTAEALYQKLPKKQFVIEHIIKLEIGQEIEIDELTKRLINMGYTRAEMISCEGEFAVRGDIVDIFPLGEEYPCRISFFDNEIEGISQFDHVTFKILKTQKKIEIGFCSLIDRDSLCDVRSDVMKDMARLKLSDESMLRLSEVTNNQLEALENGLYNVSSAFFLPFLNYFGASIFDYLSTDTTIFFDEPKLILDRLTVVGEENTNTFLELSIKGEFLPRQMEFYFERKDVLVGANNFRQVAFSRLVSQNKIFESERIENFVCQPVPRYVGKFIDLRANVLNLAKNRWAVVIATKDSATRNRLKGLFEEVSIPCYIAKSIDDAKLQGVYFLDTNIWLSANFEMERLLVIGTKDLVNHQVVKQNKIVDNTPKFLPKVGEFVVHEVHGVGKCIGIKRIKISSAERDYIIIEYKDGDLLYVPSENADQLSGFVGEAEPKCNKIGGTEFFKIKQKVKNSIKKVTFDLLKVYSERMNSKGYVYPKDNYLQKEFENAFEFDYTQDQILAIQDIKKDMESGRIMDRLICGDVGFGKTEVALVSAFKAIQEGKQVAFVCPTTILSEQHFATATARMKDFMVRVAVLNRFKTKKEQENILNALAKGEIDLICGTHRLLSKDVKFKDLGLLIIDEEQRFGVEDKDKLKNIKKNVDVLTLSATPIPRTLYMSLSGIRDVSYLNTQPKRRKMVQTSVIDYSDSLLVSACEKELARGGQVLIVYNRVETITNFYRHVQKLLPNAKIGFAHGQMSSKELEQAIYDLYSHNTQILISTVLIENGIDLPMANTLFVIDSDKLGLSQLYQLRGRIGRSDIEAYAYFSFASNKVLTQDAYKRLDALMEFSDFGSGSKIAIRDLEIRGAGDILGRTQHGHMQQVGYDMFVKLLKEAVGELKGEQIAVQREVKIDISLQAFVPESFIPSNQSRISLYTKISRISSEEEFFNLLEEVKNTYGEVPKPVRQLCTVGLIKNLSQKIGIKKIVVNDLTSQVMFYEIDDILSKFLSSPNADFVQSELTPTLITLRKGSSVEDSQKILIKFLQNCNKVTKN